MMLPKVLLTLLLLPLTCASQMRRSGGLDNVPLETKATQAGAYHQVLALPESWVAAGGIRDLTRDSSVIALVEVISNRCELGSNGTSIYTRYQVKVTELLKDDSERARASPLPNHPRVQTADKIDVTLAGGKISFANGTTAQIDVSNEPRLVVGHRYVLYLNYSPSLLSYIPTQLSRGMYEVQADGKSMRWMAVEKTDKGYRVRQKDPTDEVENARLEARENRGTAR